MFWRAASCCAARSPRRSLAGAPQSREERSNAERVAEIASRATEDAAAQLSEAKQLAASAASEEEGGGGRSFLARAHGLSDEEVAAKVGLLMKDLEATIAAELKAIRAFAHVNDLVKVSFFVTVCVCFLLRIRRCRRTVGRRSLSS